MSAHYDLRTAEGLIGYFRARVVKRENRVERRRRAGTLHPAQEHYVVHAREDLASVKKLLATLPQPGDAS